MKIKVSIVSFHKKLVIIDQIHAFYCVKFLLFTEALHRALLCNHQIPEC